ncbi:MAG: site-specific integrase [Methanofollis liminatans]|nr:site-specific integrase [Methanofollis liminatans]
METSANYFHDHAAPGYWEKQLSKAEAEGRIDAKNAATIHRFINYRQGGRGITNLRSTKLASILCSWRQVLPTDWEAATIDDLFAARVRLTTMENSKGHPYKQNTISDHIRILKSFYKWMIVRGYSSIKREELDELKAPATDTDTTDPGDLLTTEELNAMIRAAKTHRDRAILAVLYESGARIGELARLKWSDIQFDKYGVKCTINDTKEGKKRYPRLFNSTAYLAAWRNGYYGPSAEGDAYVFIGTNGEPLKYRAIAQVIERAGERAGIGKRVHPHLFRKSRITELVRKNYQESVIREVFWANAGTEMFNTYVKLSEKDIDNEFLKKAGLKAEHEINEDDDKPVQCPYCLAVNPAGSRFCRMCTRPLTVEAADAMREAEKKIEGMPEFGSLVTAMKDQVRREMVGGDH